VYFVDDVLVAVRACDAGSHVIPMRRGDVGFPKPLPSQPALDHDVRLKRAYEILPQWRQPMANRSQALSIP
jgi:hypothetical protein